MDLKYDDVDIVSAMQRHMQLLFYRELFGLDENDQPKNGGFTGIRAVLDEWEWLEPFPPLSWTPNEFNRMWQTLDHESKIAFVRNLII